MLNPMRDTVSPWAMDGPMVGSGNTRTDARLNAEGIARAAEGFGRFNATTDADRYTYPSGEAPGGRTQLNSRLKSNRGGKQVFEVFGEIEVGEFEDSSGQRLARSSAVMA
jgi:hypothetical protein